ncbi:MAG: fibro-slime domain-containing protein [Phycisphaerales bacterium]|nr:MAG: fibro-slime domain-containing protein [Phycisphaerales bacterium]
MRSPKTVRIMTYTLLSIAAIVLLSLPKKATLLRALGGERYPDVVVLRGIVRDFVEDHPDFDVVPGNGYGHYCGNIATTLGEDQKPVFVGGGSRVSREWRDAGGNEIAWCMFDASGGDSEGKYHDGPPDNGGITSAETFAQWYRDVLGVNMSTVADITMHRGSDGMYNFRTNKFFPIDGRSPSGGDGHNYHFTFEIVADFVYHESDNQMLRFMGDDDIWVFIDGRLVIDLGGIAGNTDQYIDLKRLNLVDGETYRLHFFHAERHSPKSQWRFQTNIVFDTSRYVPLITDPYD